MLDDKNKEFAYAFLADRESYHTQKETSAYAVFLVETGLFGALVTTQTVPKFLKLGSGSGAALVVFIVFVWCLLHMFMRWQLRNRRIAALQVGALILALTDHLNNRESSDVNSTKKNCCLDKYLDYVIPRPKSTYQGDIELGQYPDWYRVRYAIMQGKGTKASFGEIFPTYGSILMLFTSIVYIWLQ
jgi:hypothetical protein